MYRNNTFYTFDLYAYLKSWGESPLNLILGLLDIAIVVFILYKAVKLFKNTRAWQLLKGIAILVVITLVSRMAKTWNFKRNFNCDYDLWSDNFNCSFCA